MLPYNDHTAGLASERGNDQAETVAPAALILVPGEWVLRAALSPRSQQGAPELLRTHPSSLDLAQCLGPTAAPNACLRHEQLNECRSQAVHGYVNQVCLVFYRKTHIFLELRTSS